jgi:hypothetical protein
MVKRSWSTVIRNFLKSLENLHQPGDLTGMYRENNPGKKTGGLRACCTRQFYETFWR